MPMTNEQMGVAVHEIIATVKEEGIAGLAEHPIVEVIQGLHKSPSSAPHVDKLIQSLHRAAEVAICGTEHPTLTSIMVLFTLPKDIDTGGQAAPPANHPSAAAWAALVPKLRMGLISSLAVYPVKGSSEGKNKSDLVTAAGALAVMLLPKTQQLGLPMLQLACEAAMLRLLEQFPGCIEYMRALEGFLLHGLRDAVANAPQQVTLSLQELQEIEEGDDCGEDEEEEEEEGEDEEEEEDEGQEEGEGEEEEEEKDEQPKSRAVNQRDGKRSQPASHASNGKKMKS